MNARGSFTIEATLIMPIILFTILSVIYLSFYLYDYNRIQGMADHVLHKAVLNLKHEADIETGKVFYDKLSSQSIFYRVSGNTDKEIDIENLLTEKLSKGLLVSKIKSIEVSVNFLKIEINIEGELKIPVKGIVRLISEDKGFIIKTGAALHNPADAVRISEIALDLGVKIKGSNELEETVRKLLP